MGDFSPYGSRTRDSSLPRLCFTYWARSPSSELMVTRSTPCFNHWTAISILPAKIPTFFLTSFDLRIILAISSVRMGLENSPKTPRFMERSPGLAQSLSYPQEGRGQHLSPGGHPPRLAPAE